VGALFPRTARSALGVLWFHRVDPDPDPDPTRPQVQTRTGRAPLREEIRTWRVANRMEVQLDEIVGAHELVEKGALTGNVVLAI